MSGEEGSRNAILVLNSGSSSLKFGLFAKSNQDEDLLLKGSAEGIGRESGKLHIQSANGESLASEDHVLESQPEALQKLAAALKQHLNVEPAAVGHRVVHGGPHLREHQLLTPAVLAQLEQAKHFAPLHIPPALALIRQAQEIFSSIPHFACFDDAFHRTMPEVASHLPIPARYKQQGVIRYGFHGLSYESVVYRLGPTLPSRAVFAHLGNGSSVVAVKEGKSVDTSMGLTPTGGVPMGTRTGDLDPGVLIYLMRTESFGADELETMLNHECGLFAFSEGESDMQALLSRADSGDAAARLAIDAFSTAVRKCIGAYAALLGGLELLVFTGGIGENSAAIRRSICDGLSFLGINPADQETEKVKVLRAEEELQIARHCRSLLAAN